MRSSRSWKFAIKKKPCSYKVKKKSHKSRGMWGCNFDISEPYLDNINEVLRLHKSKKAEGSWKIVPKDSCEVYKDRRKRRIEDKRQQTNGYCEECLEDDDMMNRTSDRRRKGQKKRAGRRKCIQSRKKRKQRFVRDSSISISSNDSSGSMSRSTFSYSTVSDMEDE